MPQQKKGRHFYGVEFSNNNGQTYTAGIREVLKCVTVRKKHIKIQQMKFYLT
jgi:hypothetical protein